MELRVIILVLPDQNNETCFDKEAYEFGYGWGMLVEVK